MIETNPELHVVTFGYGHGGHLPKADITADVRDWFRDPHVSEELRGLTARDDRVIANVLDTPGVKPYTAALFEAAMVLISLKRRTVVLAVGCVGGRHRAPVIGDAIADRARLYHYTATVNHLHIDEPVLERRDVSSGPVTL